MQAFSCAECEFGSLFEPSSQGRDDHNRQNGCFAEFAQEIVSIEYILEPASLPK